jgi:hypothetical protein
MFAWGLARPARLGEYAIGAMAFSPAALAGILLAVFETTIARMRVFRAGVSWHFADARLAGSPFDVRDAESVVTGSLSYDVAHLFAGGMVLVSFMLLYQDRMGALLNMFALHAAVLSCRLPGRRSCRRAIPVLRDIAGRKPSHPRRPRPRYRLDITRSRTVVGISVTMLVSVNLVACPSCDAGSDTDVDPLGRQGLRSPSR